MNIKIKHCLIFLNLLFLFQIIVLNVSNVMAYNASDESKNFIPDSKVKELAEEFDRKYFLLFLKSIKELNQNNSELINTYFSDYPRDTTILEIIPPFEIYESKFNPVYDNKLIAMQDHLVSFPIQWTNIPSTDNSWNLYFQTLKWVSKYIRSKNTDTIFVGFKVIDDWIKTHSYYPVHNTPYAFNDHAVSYRSVVLAEAYNKYLSLNIYEPVFERRIRLSLLSHIFLMSSLEKYISYHNHGIIMDNSLINTLRILPDFSLRHELTEFAYQRMFEIYRYSFTSEGIHKEHSPCYHSQFARTLDNTLKVAKKLDIEIPPDIIKLNENALAYIDYINYDGFFPSIGDCARSRPNKLETNDLDNNYFKIFPLSGWAFIRDSVFDVRITAQACFHSSSHYQQQETSFILNVAGHEMIIDPGLFSYTPSSPYYNYMTSATAHNVVIINKSDFIPDKNNTGKSGITRYSMSDDAAYPSNGIIEMTHPHYTKTGVEVFRQLAFAGNNQIIIHDIIDSDEFNSYDLLFHLAAGAKVTKKKKYIVVQWNDHPYYLKISSNAIDYSVVEGDMDPVQGWYFPEFNVAEPSPVLILNKQDRNLEFHTTIEVFEKGIKERKLRAPQKISEQLFEKLNSQERRKLKHEPYPRTWSPNRK